MSIIELLLTQQGTLFDFATEWTKTNAYKPGSGSKQVTDSVYADFKRFAQDEMRTGGLKPEAVYAPQVLQSKKSSPIL